MSSIQLHARPLRAGALILGSALLFALAALTLRLCVNAQPGPALSGLLSAAFIDRTLGLILLLAMGGKPSLRLWQGNVVAGALVSAGSLAYYFALTAAALGVAVTLCDSYNVIAVVLAAVVSRRIPRVGSVVALMTAFAGAVVCAWPRETAASNMGMTAALVAAVVFAMALLAQRRQVGAGARTHDILFWMYLTAVVPLGARMLLPSVPLPNWTAIGYGALVAVLTLGANFLAVQAQRYGSLLQVGALVYSTGVFGCALAWLLLGEQITLATAAGMALVIAGGVASTLSEGRAQPATATPQSPLTEPQG